MALSRSVANDGQILETAQSLDGGRRWRLRRRPDGRFDHAEYRYVDLRPEGQIDGYWSSNRSGLFATAEAARDDALATLSWLPGQL